MNSKSGSEMPKKTNNKLLYWNTSNIDGARAHRDINIEEIVEGTCKYQHLIYTKNGKNIKIRLHTICK